MTLENVNNPGNIYKNVGIANGGTDSDLIDMRGSTFTGFHCGSALDGTTATFLAGTNDDNLVTLRGADGQPISVTLNGAGFYKLNPVFFLGVTVMKIKMGTTQTAARSLIAVGGDYTV